jgi:hypothetical protein
MIIFLLNTHYGEIFNLLAFYIKYIYLYLHCN